MAAAAVGSSSAQKVAETINDNIILFTCILFLKIQKKIGRNNIMCVCVHIHFIIAQGGWTATEGHAQHLLARPHEAPNPSFSPRRGERPRPREAAVRTRLQRLTARTRLEEITQCLSVDVTWRVGRPGP